MTTIGDTLYLYNENRRIYTNDDGTKRSTPNPREHWVACQVTGETRDSWILSRDGIKASKKDRSLRGDHVGYSRYACTAEEKDDRLWHDTHVTQVYEAVLRADAPTLRKIAALLGIE